MYAGYRRCVNYKMAVSRNTNIDVFFNLVRAGLWEQDVQLALYGIIDFNEVYRLAEEQSVVGLVAAGIEHIVDVKVSQEVALTFVGSALQLEQRNKAMNQFIGVLIEKLKLFPNEIILRNKIAERYAQIFQSCYQTPIHPTNDTCVWAQYTLKATDPSTRKRAMEAFGNHGIPTVIYYPKPLHLQKAFTDVPVYTSLEVTKQICTQVLSLPFGPYITDEELRTVAEALKGF